MIILVIGQSYWFRLVQKILKHYFKKNSYIITNNVNINLKKILKKKKILYLFNFFSSEIIKEEHLKKIRYPINFHGGSLKYPGRGGYCHAIFKAEKIYGCVAHIMSNKVDTGKIIKELNFKISDYETVESLKFKTYLNSLALFYEIIIKIINNKPLIFEKKKWKRKPYKLIDLKKINIIKKHYTKQKIKKIKQSTIYYPYGPFIIKNNKIKQMKIKFSKNLI